MSGGDQCSVRHGGCNGMSFTTDWELRPPHSLFEGYGGKPWLMTNPLASLRRVASSVSYCSSIRGGYTAVENGANASTAVSPGSTAPLPVGPGPRPLEEHRGFTARRVHHLVTLCLSTGANTALEPSVRICQWAILPSRKHPAEQVPSVRDGPLPRAVASRRWQRLLQQSNLSLNIRDLCKVKLTLDLKLHYLSIPTQVSSMTITESITTSSFSILAPNIHQ